MPGLIKGPGLSLTSSLAYYNSSGFWSGAGGFIDPSAMDRLGMYFNLGLYRLNGVEYAAATSVPGWTFSGGTTTNGANRYAENSAGQLVTFASGVPRTTDRGLLVEEARTNLLTYSQQFDNAAWTKNATTVTADAAIAPDGTTTADKLAETATTASHNTTATSVTVTSGAAYTYVVYAKAAERSWIALYDTVRAQGKFFNVSSGSIGGNLIAAPDSASILALANGWFRCTITITTTSTSSVPSVWLSTDGSSFSYAGVAGSGVFIWQADLQAGSFPTSPIVTTNAAATRAADNASVTGLGSILAAPVTLVGWGDFAAVNGVNRVLAAISDGTSANVVQLQRNSSNALATAITAGGVSQATDSASGYAGAITPKAAQRVLYVAQKASYGGVLSTGNAITAPTGMTRLDFGQIAGGGSGYANGYIPRIQVLGNTSDGQLQLLTV